MTEFANVTFEHEVRYVQQQELTKQDLRLQALSLALRRYEIGNASIPPHLQDIGEDVDKILKYIETGESRWLRNY
jgi:hypothetical protein